ncbi:MAG: mechanosensitive ion channel domain-containing protein, partial [Myxococcota bacterium]|nr:mechanosensitive ion channel domain-containing protein [Myxococcota bacterium]
MEELINTVEGWFGQNPIYDGLISSALLLVFAGLFFFAIRLAISRGIRRLIRKTETHWDDALYDAGFFYRLTLVVPILVVRQGLDFIPHLPESAYSLLARIVMALAIVVAVQVAIALLNAAGTIYRTTAGASRHSIKGYLQIGQILVVGVGVVLTLAVLMDRSPLVFLGGMGAMTAVLMLVFKDTILGFVASVQIATNDMLRVGDWIEMPSAGADGDVLDIALYTAKVQNWDKTITTIPTYMLIQESFRNWRGMS